MAQVLFFCFFALASAGCTVAAVWAFCEDTLGFCIYAAFCACVFGWGAWAFAVRPDWLVA